ncbi:MAG: hypothetical protein ACKO24_11785 [Leptolyngbyaceae cyanobacterium]
MATFTGSPLSGFLQGTNQEDTFTGIVNLPTPLLSQPLLGAGITNANIQALGGDDSIEGTATVTVTVSRPDTGSATAYGVYQASVTGGDGNDTLIIKGESTLASSGAGIVTFSSRDSFNQAINANPSLIKTVEGWDTYAPSTVEKPTTAFPNGSTVNGITYNVTNAEALVVNTGISLSPPNNLYQTGSFSTFNPLVDTFTFGFSQPITAFGITFSSTFANTPGAYLATTNLGDVASSSFDPLPGFSDIGEFVGFTSARPFTSVTISSTVNAYYGMDDLIYAAQPTPDGGMGSGPVIATGYGVYHASVDGDVGDDSIIISGTGFGTGFSSINFSSEGNGIGYGVYQASVDGGSGNDSITISGTGSGTGGSNIGGGSDGSGTGYGVYQASVDGGSGNDSITISSTGSGTGAGSGSGSGFDNGGSVTGYGISQAFVDGGCGNDAITISGTGDSSDFDFGGGSVTGYGASQALVEGGCGDDAITISSTGDGSGFDGIGGGAGYGVSQTSVNGGGGNDSITIRSMVTGGTVIAYGVSQASVNGGVGDDSIIISGIAIGTGSTDLTGEDPASGNGSGTGYGVSKAVVIGGDGKDVISISGTASGTGSIQ